MYKILIVEDDPVIASSLARQLTRWNYEATYVQEFDHVMQEFEKAQPDLVLMDITLPYFSGYYWCAEIRKISRVPIVFLSSAADEMNQVMALSMGADDFIAKPSAWNLPPPKLALCCGGHTICRQLPASSTPVVRCWICRRLRCCTAGEKLSLSRMSS